MPTRNSITARSTSSTGSSRTARGPASSICTAAGRSSTEGRERESAPVRGSLQFPVVRGSIPHAALLPVGAFDGQDPTSAPRIDHFFSAVAARLDLWRDLSRAAQAWAANPASRGDAGALRRVQRGAHRARCPWRTSRPTRARASLNAIKERLAGGDALGAARLVQRVSSALMSRSYRSDAGEWESEEDDAAPGARDADGARRRPQPSPYFEVLFVTPTAAGRAGPPRSSRSGSCGAPRTSSSTSPCSSARSRTRRWP